MLAYQGLLYVSCGGLKSCGKCKSIMNDVWSWRGKCEGVRWTMLPSGETKVIVLKKINLNLVYSYLLLIHDNVASTASWQLVLIGRQVFDP